MGDLVRHLDQAMRRWNGWGEESIDFPLPRSAAAFLAERIGPGERYTDASIEAVLASVPDSRLPIHSSVNTDAHDRLLHARGQSLPDWIALRSGRIGVFPDGVAYPAEAEDVRACLQYAQTSGARLIPYGGGTSVVGHINPLHGEAPTLTLDLGRLNRPLEMDTKSGLAAFEAGIIGPALETHLHGYGFTLGHFPQSFEFSTLGGWIATRSSGQQSLYYGRVEDFFAGGRVETPVGRIDLPAHPASAAGPDLRQLVLGSEGRLGVITRATVRVRPLPPVERFEAVLFKSWEAGVAAAREMVQAGVGVSMLRLSDPRETETTLALSADGRLLQAADQIVSLLGYGEGRCILILGLTGAASQVSQARRMAAGIARSRNGLPVGGRLGELWRRTRFRAPYLRNTLWEMGYALDTLETAVPWTSVEAVARDVLAELGTGLAPEGEKVLAFAHLSHHYRDGAGVYVTYLFRRLGDPDATLQRWKTLKGAASRAILEHGGTISHQHGVGQDHAPYLEAEKGRVGMNLLNAVSRAVDPDSMLNPGKLLPGD